MEIRDYRGQQYVQIGERPYTRRDGGQTTLAIWRSQCAQCGEKFEFKTSTTALKFEPNRRCQKHHRPGSKVKLRRVRMKSKIEGLKPKS